MKRKWKIAFGGAIVLLAIAGGGATLVDLSAAPDPGALETAVARKGKHALVAFQSRHIAIPASKNIWGEEGEKLYGAECSMCHGMDARTPTGLGRSMYPRAVDLGTPQVQAYSDRELFWIVKNGIRLTGMPAFGKSESDDHIWAIVHHLRTVSATSQGSQPVAVSREH